MILSSVRKERVVYFPYFIQTMSSFNLRANFYELCTEISRLAFSCALEARIGK